MAFFFLIVGICANLFAASVEDRYATGVEPAMVGLMCGVVASYIYHWDRLPMEWC